MRFPLRLWPVLAVCFLILPFNVTLHAQNVSQPGAANAGVAGPQTANDIGLAVAPSEANVVCAVMGSNEGVLWRSDDEGRGVQPVHREGRSGL